MHDIKAKNPKPDAWHHVPLEARIP